MDIVSSVNTSITFAKRLREISKNVSEAEFKNVLTDLMNELADLKLEIVQFKEELANLQEENRVLKATQPHLLITFP